jgi:hypothetical protein
MGMSYGFAQQDAPNSPTARNLARIARVGRVILNPPYLSDYFFASARLSALTIALIDASSMFVSIPAPKSVRPRSVLIWM